MVTGLIVTALLGALDAVLSLLPSWSLPTLPGNDGTFAIVGQMNGIIPIADLLTCLLATIALLLALRVWELGVWVFHQFWGSD